MKVRSRAWGMLALWSVLGVGCASTNPPPSRFPNAQAALERLRATFSCGYGTVGEAKIDYFGNQGRIRASLLYLTHLPDKVRLDIVSPFGATISTLTTNGKEFAHLDLREKQFLTGPANACSLERWLHVPVPPGALVQLLRGEPPILQHSLGQARLSWEGGRYQLRIEGQHAARELIEFVPNPESWSKPFAQQELRVLQVRTEQQGYELYRVELAGHARATTARPRVDPDGIDPPLPPSGPQCNAEVPRRLHFEVDGGSQDLIIENTEVFHNPPLPDGVFEQVPARGLRVRSEPCSQ